MTESTQIRDDLARFFGDDAPPEVVSAYLYGSHARGRAHRESDVDVGVVLDRKSLPSRDGRFDFRIRLASRLIAALHRDDVDVVPLDDVTPELSAAAVTEGERIYCRDEADDARFRHLVLSRRADLRPWLARMRRLKLEVLRR